MIHSVLYGYVRHVDNSAIDLGGKKVLITGASSGIGAGLAEEFARRGATVGICARRVDRLAEVLGRCRQHSPASRMWIADLSAPGAPENLAATAVEELGGLDILVNNAGIPKRRHVTRLDGDTVEAVMRVNFLAPARLTLALLPHLAQTGEGRVVNISSVAATLSSPNESAYDASKAALSVFSEALAVDMWNRGVEVLVVYPGLVDTELVSAPDNDPVVDSPAEPVAVSEVVAAVFDGLDRHATQIYVPGFFEELAAGKARDVPAFLEGAAAFVASQPAPDAGTAAVPDSARAHTEAEDPAAARPAPASV